MAPSGPSDQAPDVERAEDGLALELAQHSSALQRGCNALTTQALLIVEASTARGIVRPTYRCVNLSKGVPRAMQARLGDLHGWRIGQTPDGRALIFVNTKTLELANYKLP